MKKKQIYFIHHIRYLALGLLCFMATIHKSQAQCTVVANTSGYNSSYTQIYVLTDASGVILAQNSTGVFTTPTNGTYHIHALNYDPASPPSPLPASIIGQPISNVGSMITGCYNADFLTDFVVRVCGCVQNQTICAGDPLIVSSPGSMSGYTQLYVLATPSGTIIATNATGDFSNNVIAGNNYQIYALNYNPSSPPNPLPSQGLTIADVGSMNQGCMNLDFFNDYVCYAVNNCAVCQQTNTVPQGAVYTSDASGYASIGYTQLYFLVDPLTNEVLEVNATGIFTYNYPIGTTYQVYALNYNNAEPPVPIPAQGQNINVLGTSTTGCYNNNFNIDYVCNTIDVPLPVDALTLTGYISGTTHILNWKTTTEINNDYFNLEWSADNQNFHPIHQIEGSGNSSIPRYYTYTHTHPTPGLNYYRIKQVDIGGAATFSNTIALSKDKKLLVNLYPSPVGNQLTIETEGATGLIAFNIYNDLGQKVFSDEWEATAFIYQKTINVSELASGVYLYKLINMNEGINGKLLKD